MELPFFVPWCSSSHWRNVSGISYTSVHGNLDWQCVSFVVAFRRTRGETHLLLWHDGIVILVPWFSSSHGRNISCGISYRSVHGNLDWQRVLFVVAFWRIALSSSICPNSVNNCHSSSSCSSSHWRNISHSICYNLSHRILDWQCVLFVVALWRTRGAARPSSIHPNSFDNCQFPPPSHWRNISHCLLYTSPSPRD